MYVFAAGDMYEVGAESGRYYCLNVPLRDGIDDQSEFSSCKNLLLKCQTCRTEEHLELNYHVLIVSEALEIHTLCVCVCVCVCVCFRLQAAVPAGYQTGGGFLPADLHRSAGH